MGLTACTAVLDVRRTGPPALTVPSALCQVRDKDLYNDLDTEVKRQIWTDHQTLFGDEVSPLFIQYVQQKEAALLTHTNLSNFFDLTPKVGQVAPAGPHAQGGAVLRCFIEAAQTLRVSITVVSRLVVRFEIAIRRAML